MFWTSSTAASAVRSKQAKYKQTNKNDTDRDPEIQ